MTPPDPRLRICTADAVAIDAAAHLASLLRTALDQRPTATLALSGGSTPAATFAALALEDLPWDRVFVVQVDERVSSIVDGDRNLTMQQATLAAHVDLAGLLSMPVGEANLERAAASYAEDLREVAGDPTVIDVVQLGLGSDGHTASLIPGDAALAERDRMVAIAGPYQGRQRMTLTVPVIARARHRVWIVTGASKAHALQATLRGDRSVPAAHVVGNHDKFFVDPAAAGA